MEKLMEMWKEMLKERLMEMWKEMWKEKGFLIPDFASLLAEELFTTDD